MEKCGVKWRSGGQMEKWGSDGEVGVRWRSGGQMEKWGSDGEVGGSDGEVGVRWKSGPDGEVGSEPPVPPAIRALHELELMIPILINSVCLIFNYHSREIFEI